MEYHIKDIIDKTDELIELSDRLKVNCKSDVDLAVFPILTHNAIIGMEKGILEKNISEDTDKLRDGIEVLSFMADHSYLKNEDFPFTSDFESKNIPKISVQLKKYRELLIWKLNTSS